ncbi:VanZ family protein [Hydrogenophaga sp. MI9]|uniref:VanZ family protein n=1 Tax=Hydrogenophaga sp. MI9 TaxID=3453719 RepID=UPI003EEB9228
MSLRMLLVSAGLLLAYQLVQLPVMRGMYYRWDKMAHAMAFATVYLALAWALRWPRHRVAMLAAALGAAVEIHQFFLPGFSPSLGDWVADLVGIGLVMAASREWKIWNVGTNR